MIIGQAPKDLKIVLILEQLSEGYLRHVVKILLQMHILGESFFKHFLHVGNL